MRSKTQGNPVAMLAVLFAASFISALNENIMGIGLSDIARAFDVDTNTANWLVTGFMIVATVVSMLTAFFMRRFTLRQLYLATCVLLVGGCIGDILAPSFPLLFAARIVQASGTGIFVPLMMNTVLAVAPKERLGTYLSIGSCCVTFGPAFAPVVAGFTITSFGWRAMFAVPAAAIALLFFAGLALTYNISEPEHLHADIPSVAIAAGGLTALVLGLSNLTSNLVLALAALTAGIALVALFAHRQARLTEPLLNLGPLRTPMFVRSCALVMITMITMFSMSVIMPLYFSAALGANALTAGLYVLVPVAMQVGASLLGGRIFDKRGEWPLLPAGFALMLLGLAVVARVAAALDPVAVVLAACVVYAGTGLVYSPSQTSGLKGLSKEMHPHGVGISNTLTLVGAALGPSLFVGIYSSGATPVAGFSNAVLVACAIAAVGMLVAFYHAQKARPAR